MVSLFKKSLGRRWSRERRRSCRRTWYLSFLAGSTSALAVSEEAGEEAREAGGSQCSTFVSKLGRLLVGCMKATSRWSFFSSFVRQVPRRAIGISSRWLTSSPLQLQTLTLTEKGGVASAAMKESVCPWRWRWTRAQTRTAM